LRLDHWRNQSQGNALPEKPGKTQKHQALARGAALVLGGRKPPELKSKVTFQPKSGDGVSKNGFIIFLKHHFSLHNVCFFFID
jgi:hypothetical protein